LHPGDLAHPATAASIERGLDAWLSVRKQTFYRTLAGAAGTYRRRGATRR
jgi:hypothetical protein